MNPFVSVILVLLLIAIVGVLLTGIIGFIKGGEFNKKYGNKLMQARVVLQGITIALLALAFFFSHK